MKTQLAFKFGSLAFVLLGFGHLVTYLVSPRISEQLDVLHVMQSFKIYLAGTESNLMLLHEGFSLMMGVLLIGYGVLNFELIRRFPELILSSYFLILLNVFVSLLSLFISIKYFFLVPILFTSISFICFCIVIGRSIVCTRQSSPTNK